jgi:hypothetical protein
MALQPRRQPSSYSPPWEPEIVLNIIQGHWCDSVTKYATDRQTWTRGSLLVLKLKEHLINWDFCEISSYGGPIHVLTLFLSL